MEVISMKGLVEKAHGKICQDSDSSVSYRKKDGAMFSMRMCNPRNLETHPYSTKEKEIQANFSEASKIAAAWTKANRVFKSNGRTIDYENCTEDYKKMRAAFDAQDKIMTFQAFVRAQIKDGAVVVPDVAVSTSTGGSSSDSGSGSSTTPSGSNENSGGSEENGGEENPDGNLD